MRPSQTTPRSSNSSALPTVSGSTLKYSRNVRGFALRIGATSPATPFLMPTTTVNCWPASSPRVVAKSPWPDDWAFTRFLGERDVYVLPGTVADVPGYFRISLTASDAMIDRALPAFAAAARERVPA